MSNARESSSPKEEQRREEIWKSSRLNSNFFEIFGEPESVRAEGDDKIVLIYPFGEKTIDTAQAYSLKHWETFPSVKWRKKGDIIEAEFLFRDIPNAKAWGWVAYNMDELPDLYEKFEKIPKEAQEEIIEEVRKLIQSPEDFAKKRFEFITEQNEYQRKIIKELVDNIIFLQAPGEIFIGSHDIRGQEEVGWRYGGETGGTDHYADKTYTSHFLVTGARKRERSDWRGAFKGGHSFQIDRTLKQEEKPEEIRKELLTKKRNELKNLLDKERKHKSIPDDPRIYDLKPEEWTRRYAEAWDSVRKEAEQKWQEEEHEMLEKLRIEQESYEVTTTQLKQAREEKQKKEKHARTLGIDLYSSGIEEPKWGEIGDDLEEDLKKCLESLQKYIAAADAFIADQLRQCGERDFAVAASKEKVEKALREEMEAGATPATWFLSGIDPGEFEVYGRKPGEGFGEKVAGKRIYLPGNKTAVGIKIGGGRSKYRKIVNYFGLKPLDGDSLTAEVSKSDAKILALAEDPNWKVSWTEEKDGEPYCYHLVNSKGTGSIYGDRYESKDWNNIEGAGPTMDEIRAVHNLQANSGIRKEKSWLERGDEGPKRRQKTSSFSRGPSIGGDVFAVALEKSREKEPKGAVPSSPAPQRRLPVQEKRGDQKIEKSEAREIKAEAQSTLLLIETIARAISIKAFSSFKNKKEETEIKETTKSLKEKKAELLRDVESFKGEVLLATISNKQEQDRILGKVASFRNRAEKLANSKEAKLLKPDGLAENWQKTLSDLWDMCPRAVIAETEDIVHESKRGALISNVREKLMEHIKKIQSGQEIQLKPIIDDIAEGFME